MLKEFKNFVHLNNLKVLPVSNAKVERAFSIMKMVKSDWRSSLSSAALKHLIRINIERSEIDKYCAKACVQVFFPETT